MTTDFRALAAQMGLPAYFYNSRIFLERKLAAIERADTARDYEAMARLMGDWESQWAARL